MNDDHAYLDHILECITRIEQYVSDGRESFMASTLIQDATVHNMHIMAESTQRLSDPVKASYPEVDWPRLASLRNILVHGYLGLNMATVWGAIEQELPNFKGQIAAILRDLGEAAI